MEQVIPMEGSDATTTATTPNEKKNPDGVSGEKKNEKRLKILSLSAVNNNVNIRGSLTPYNLRPSEILKRRLSAGSLKNACKSTPTRKSVLRRKLRMSNLTKIMAEPNQRREDFESENIISDAEPNEDFKENNNSEQLTFKEFEADVMDSSLIHDSSYRVQSSQEDNEAFVSAVEEFTDGSADVTLTGAADFGNFVSADEDSEENADQGGNMERRNSEQREANVLEQVSTATPMNETFIKTDETQLAAANEAEIVKATETPATKTQHPPKTISASVNYCLTPENDIQTTEWEASKENPKKVMARSARKSVHFSAIVSKIPRSSQTKQSTKAKIRKSLAFLPHSSAAAAKQAGYNNPRKTTVPYTRTLPRSSFMPMKPTGAKKQSVPRASLAPKRISVAAGNKNSNNDNASAKRDLNLKRLEHLLQPTSTTLKRYQRHTISSASKVRPNHLTPAGPQDTDTTQAAPSNVSSKRMTLVASRKSARPSEKLPFRLF